MLSSHSSNFPVVTCEVRDRHPVHLKLFHWVLQFKVDYGESRTIRKLSTSLDRFGRRSNQRPSDL